MTTQTKEMYSEVYSILNMLGESYINKLPSKLFNLIETSRKINYNPKYDSTIALEKQNIKSDTVAMIALFHLNYWCESDKEKQQLIKLFNDNEKKYQAELREKYNPDNIFKNQTVNTVPNPNEQVVTETAMVGYKESVWVKIKKWFQSLFSNKK